MFCPKCGTQLPDTAVACSNCGTSFATTRPGGAGARAGVAGERMKAASTDAFHAFKTFATNPVGGLSEAYDSLGQSRALAVGITFGVVFAACLMIAIYRVVPEFMRPTGAGGFIKILVIALVPFVALFIAALAVRTVFRGEGELGSDSFLAGAALLPFGLVALIMTLLGASNMEVIQFFAIFAVTLTILMLFAGLTRIYKTSERMATIAIPLMLVVTAWLSKVIYKAMLNQGGGMGSNPFGQ
jgi:hypothetical protein